MKHIEGGYYLKARQIQESAIAQAAPYVREIWDWILKEANFVDTKVCKRGQLIRTFRDIQEGLAWFAGWRKYTYSKDQCEKAMKWLRNASMIATEKTTRGLVITVLNYAKFQDPRNYENNYESNTKATTQQQPAATINNEFKKGKNVMNKVSEASLTPTLEEIKTYCDERKNKIDPERFFNTYEATGWMLRGSKIKDWRAIIRNWEKSDAISAGGPAATTVFHSMTGAVGFGGKVPGSIITTGTSNLVSSITLN
jgi:hypothetical protein